MIYLIWAVIALILTFILGFWVRGKFDDMFKYDPEIEGEVYIDGQEPIYPDED